MRRPRVGFHFFDVLELAAAHSLLRGGLLFLFHIVDSAIASLTNDGADGSPIAIRIILPVTFRSKTMIGIWLSRHMATAEASMTAKLFRKHLRIAHFRVFHRVANISSDPCRTLHRHWSPFAMISA